MQDRIRDLLDNLTKKWQGLEQQQRLRLGMGVLCLAVAIGVTLYFALRPEWYTLLSNRDLTVTSRAQTILNDAGIRNEVRQGGTSLVVLARDNFAARSVLNEHPDVGGMTSFFDFQDYIDSVGFGVSQAVQGDMAMMALQNRIAQSIREMAGISDATVHLDIPDTRSRIFGNAAPATASVFINHQGNIDYNAARSIAELVASAVSSLDVENVRVTNQRMDVLFSGDTDPMGMGGGILSDFEMELRRRNLIQTNVHRLLAPHFDDLRVLTAVVVDTDQVTTDTRTPIRTDEEGNTGALYHRIVSREQAQSEGAAGGEPGLGANDQMGAPYMIGGGGGGTSSANRQHTEELFEHGWEHEVIRHSVGNMVANESSIAVIGYRHTFFDQAHMEDNGLLGEQTWIEFVEERRAMMPLDISDTLSPALIAGVQAASGIPLENVALAAFEMFYFNDRVITPFDWQLLVVFALLAILLAFLALSLFKRNQPEEILEVAPELSVEDLLVSTQLEEEEEAVEALKDIDYSADSDIKKQIDKFVEDKPEAVAQLLRNWLNDSWE